MVLAKERYAGILDVEDGFEDGTEREARSRGHVVVEKERFVGRTGTPGRSRDTIVKRQNLKIVHEDYLDLFCNIN